MMHYNIIPSALVITFLLTLIISLIFSRPLRALWIFFIIVFMATWASQLWINPIGPVFWGVAWVPMLVASVFFWLLILALIPPFPKTQAGTEEKESASMVLGMFFWIMLVVLLITIAVGYYRIP
ncbi:MAG TPA: hypothetical protein VLB84_02680 [Bacteroidia bacterium]|jgi:hypothetical protein|nr:hypothetical protein [Bacteroidia bacterium]